jgi:hypothetical protein
VLSSARVTDRVGDPAGVEPVAALVSSPAAAVLLGPKGLSQVAPASLFSDANRISLRPPTSVDSSFP